MRLFIDIKTEEQLKRITEAGIPCSLIIPAGMVAEWSEELHATFSGTVYASLPEVLRENRSSEAGEALTAAEKTGIKGVMVKNLDELGLIIQEGYKGEVIADSFLYAYNSIAAESYRKLIPDLMTVLPEELSDDELASLGRKYPDPANLIYRIYGRQRLMVTAQETALENFRNSKGDRFISVWDDVNEYTVVYNQAPTSMLDKSDGLNWSNYLAELTTESGKELENVLKALKQFAAGNSAQLKGTVRGYHYKSVE